jgi:Tripartite tricarboxylate transporter family receptor
MSGAAISVWRAFGAIVATLIGLAFFFVITGVAGVLASIVALGLFVVLAIVIFRRPLVASLNRPGGAPGQCPQAVRSSSGPASRPAHSQITPAPSAIVALANQESDTMQGILVPARTPQPIIDLLYLEVVKVVGLPDVKDRMTELGFETVADTPDEFAARIKVEIPKWAKVIHDANIKIE